MMSRDRNERGERGPMGDHGQDGRVGPVGKTGSTGEKGSTGAAGVDGRFLSRNKSLAGFLFVVVAFLLLAYNTQTNISELQDINERRNVFLNEFCQTSADLAPAACALSRPDNS